MSCQSFYRKSFHPCRQPIRSVIVFYNPLRLFTLWWGWSGGAMVLGKLPVPGRPTSLENSKARAYCVCSWCGRGGLDIFSLIYHFSLLSPSLWETARYRLNYCLKGPLSPKQPTNQPTLWWCSGRTHGPPYQGYDYVRLRFGGNVVRRLGTQH